MATTSITQTTPYVARASDSRGRVIGRVESSSPQGACRLADETFLILPHKEVIDYRRNKCDDYDRWLGGMRKLRRRFGNPRT